MHVLTVVCCLLSKQIECRLKTSLEALSMHNGWSTLVVLLLGDPHLLEGGEGGQDGAADPYGVLPLGGGDDLDLHGAGGQGGDLLLHPVGKMRINA